MAKPALGGILHQLRMLAASPDRGQDSDQQLLQRFLERHDQAAFTSLLQRHGPMVHELCCRMLHQQADIDDVFQSTFLVLVRKAKTIRKQPSLASWLYGVAFRIASRVRRQTVQKSPTRLRKMSPPADPALAAAWREISLVLDAEVQALSEPLRAAIVLCYLEGRTRDQAAHQLGCSLRTLERRLEQARGCLRRRLTRRGFSLPSVFLASGLSQHTMAAVPSVLCSSLLQPLQHFERHGTLAGSQVSSRVMKLVAEASSGVAMKLPSIALAVLATGLVIAGSGALVVFPNSDGRAGATQNDTPASIGPADERPGTVPKDRVDRFGDPLPEGAVVRLGSVRLQLGSRTWSVALSPDGKTIAACSNAVEPLVRQWDASTGEEKQAISVGAGVGSLFSKGMMALAYSPDGTMLAGGCYGLNWAVLMEASTGRVRQCFGGTKQGITCVAFSPDGKTLVWGGYDKTVSLA